jgi:hypothetical protein
MATEITTGPAGLQAAPAGAPGRLATKAASDAASTPAAQPAKRIIPPPGLQAITTSLNGEGRTAR